MNDASAEGPIYRIEMFGGLTVIMGDQAVTRFRTQKDAELLAYLACYDKQSHLREKLIDVLWPEVELETGRNRLRQTLASLRRTLGANADSDKVLLADRHTIGINSTGVSIDVAIFRSLLQQVRRATEPEPIEEALREATSLLQRDFLNGCYSEWVVLERRRLEGAYQQALLNAVSVLGKSKEYGAALALAEQACSREPMEERIHLTIMHLHAALGDYPAVRGHYKMWERVLLEELGERPPTSAQALLWELLEPERRAAQAAEQAPATELPRASQASATRPVDAVHASNADPVAQEGNALPVVMERRPATMLVLFFLCVAGIAMATVFVQATARFHAGRSLHKYPAPDMRLQAVLNYPYHVLFTNISDSGRALYVMSPDGRCQAKLADDAICGSYSPDGKQIVFVSRRTGMDKIWVMNADGSQPRQITFGDYTDEAPCWSPDSRQIAFSSQREIVDAIYVMNADGSNPHRLTYGLHDSTAHFSISWSPNGKQIAYSAQSEKSHVSACFLIDVDGKNNHQITQMDSAIPCWSPDGKWIAFDGVEGPKRPWSIFLMDLAHPDRSHMTRLTIGFTADWARMSWCPDGRHIMCASLMTREACQIYCIPTDASHVLKPEMEVPLTVRRNMCVWPSCSPLRDAR